MKKVMVCAFILMLHPAVCSPVYAIEYPGQPQPGSARVQVAGNSVTLENNVIAFTFEVNNHAIQNGRIDDKTTTSETPIQMNEPFLIKIGSVNTKASDLPINGSIRTETVRGNPDAGRLAERFDAKAVRISYKAPDNSYNLDWKAILRNGSNYILFEMTIEVLTGNLNLTQVTLIDVKADSPQVVGAATGSPVVANRYFLGFQHPLAKYTIDGTGVRGYYDRPLAVIPAGQKKILTAAVGMFPENQLRRAFNFYIDRERVQPYHHFLHYNSWYDIAHSDRPKRFDEAESIDRIRKYGRELKTERGVGIENFTFDDPWDNISGTATDVWQFDPARHPNQWLNMKTAAQSYGASLGAWMSPRGGYGHFQSERINTAVRNGLPYDTSGGIFKLSDENYFARYRSVALDMLNNQAVRYYKFDGFTSGQDAERERLFNLSDELRAVQPDIFINMTIGSWPCPYFLMHGDSVWRGGEDFGFTGEGSERQRHITYRDNEFYRNVISPNPLYPFASTMIHGTTVAAYMPQAGLRTTPPASEFKEDCRAFFAMGVNVQELYIGPDNPDTGTPIMTEELWDILAETIKWARANEDVLGDAKWIGASPDSGRIYGVSHWSENKAIIMLRNPDSKNKSITLDPKDIFELPANAAVRQFVMKSPWAEDTAKPPIVLQAGKTHQFSLAPFEVLVLQACRDR